MAVFLSVVIIKNQNFFNRLLFLVYYSDLHLQNSSEFLIKYTTPSTIFQIFLKNPVGNGRQRFAQERTVAGGHFVDDDAERENIGEAIN